MMTQQKTELEKHIESGKPVLIAEMVPPRGADALRVSAKLYAGKVHALGVSDNPGDVRMAALAAAALVASEGVEPILHIVTRDRNRIALISECLGAQALGIRNLLCTTGTYSAQGAFADAKNVFDIDSTQLLQMYYELEVNGSAMGAEDIEQVGPLCLGAVASPYADPLEMQVMRLAKKVTAGAKFVVTPPVFDFERFRKWWDEVNRRDLSDKVAIIAGVQPLTSAEQATFLAARRPSAMIPQSVVERISARTDEKEQRAEGIAIAAETIERLAGVEGLRGLSIRADGDDDATIELLAKSGLEL
jgi:methylenetetrahydrofolate reductase (NADPH)